MNRQRLLLAGLALVLVASLLYAFWAMPRQETAPPRASSAKPAAKAAAAPPAVAGKGERLPKPATDRLQLELLNREPWEFPGADRDIFRFRGGWAPPVVVASEPVEDEPPPPPPPPPPTPEEILHQKVAGLTFLGFLEKAGVRTVFLAVDGEVVLVKAGDRFGKDKLLVAREITAKQLVVGWLQGAETVRIQLLEKLSPATITAGGEKAGSAGSAPAPGLRPVGTPFSPRRVLVPQRVPMPPPAGGVPLPDDDDDDVEDGEDSDNDDDDDDDDDGVNMEELLKRGLPRGE
jgi:hypothetical protein